MKNPFWADYNDNDLMELSLSELKLSLKGSMVDRAIGQVKTELTKRRLWFKLNFWPGTEWFCPDGYSGISVPFYLIHPRLVRLEKKMVGYAEGESYERCLRLLRHETGHAIDNTFMLRRRRDRVGVFGKSSTPYPSSYEFKFFSKSFVKNLEDGYAQSHPVEDFAETFAVWLDPESNWKKKYIGWPCYRKLLYMDSVMNETKNMKPMVVNLEEHEPVSGIDMTLGKYYEKKCRRLCVGDSFWKVPLKKVFICDKSASSNFSAIGFLRKYRTELIDDLRVHTGYPKYKVKRMYNDLLSQSSGMRFSLSKDELEIKDVMSYHLKRKAKNYFNQGRHQIIL